MDDAQPNGATIVPLAPSSSATTASSTPPECRGLCVSNSNDANARGFCGVEKEAGSLKECADGIRVVVRCPPAASVCSLSDITQVLGSPVPFKSESFDLLADNGLSPSFCRSNLPSVFLCRTTQPNTPSVTKLNVTTTTATPSTFPESSVLAPSITTTPPVAEVTSSPGPLIGGCVCGLVLVALAVFLFIQRSRRSRHQQPVADDDLEAFPYAIAQTPKALPLLANTDINTTHPVAFAPVHSISDDDDLPVLDATVPTSTMSSSALTVPSSDGPSSRHNLPDRIRASRPDLTDLWMSSLDLVKANPLKGGDLDLKVVTIQGKKVVVRVLANAADASSTTSHAFFDSIQFIRRIMHPHITSVLGVGCLQHHEDVAVATEFMDQGSLGAYLLQLKKQPSSTAATLRGPLHLALHIGRALDYLHTTHNLAFGSIHPDKVLVYRDSTADDDNPRVGAKLSVFHLMARGPHGAVYEPKRACSNTSGLANNVAFLAPERRTYTDNEPTMASDVYALAVVAAMIWTTEAPHSALYHEQGLVRGDVFLYNHSDTFPYSSLPGMPTPLADLLRQCWQVHPASRPSVATLVAALEQFAQ